ncbi:Aminodeoxychorismate synthase component 1 [Candidatus Terasakiella magnetica]|uniref:aminodeoxychorismate synthase n=1 Tax=Candidatus Terasakiella magnetica TaxID=1867952 RepID=A0A1C3RLK4_9PROT|nr:aminodeoxychorismate synthase component I [Candidatus Terasakiella magnetica]SCA58166.1 Aminodeoxychorismate synthase component 1 [Candidatus Terasakiella magnetica]
MKKPVFIEIAYQDPAKLFAPHANTPFAVFLDSSRNDSEQGRYSYIGLDPIKTFTSSKNIFSQLKKALSDFTFESHEGLAPFQGGLMGYFGYELLHQIEDLPRKDKDHFATPDVALGLYDCVAAFDHHEGKAWVFSLSGLKRAQELVERLTQPQLEPPLKGVCLNWSSDFTKESYVASVQKVIDYIHAGDIFQANLTQRFSADLPEGFAPYALYQKLRAINPAPFAAYLNFEGFSLASSSPERFLQTNGSHVETCPIKGTRPRSLEAKADQANAHELRNSEKDRAENTMIVDLLRNDISKVCKPHSVDVPELCEVHSFASVHHLVSTVTGELQEGFDSIDLLKASFPGGSITGAPKVRAMEIISELEPCARGPYCGAIGYIGGDGTMDTNIVIRTLVFKGGQVCAQVGGGIVSDSQPNAEYQETLDKAQALFDAFEKDMTA